MSEFISTDPCIFTAFQVAPAGEKYEYDFFSLIASVEAQSQHPMAKSIVQMAKKNNIPFHPVIGLREFSGAGIGGAVEISPGVYRAVMIGKREFLRESGLDMPDILEVVTRKWKSEGALLSFGGWDGWVRGVLKFSKI